MRSRVLIVGAGDVGLKIADRLLGSGRVMRLTLADLPGERGVKAAGMLASCHDATVRFRPLDGTDPGAVEALIAREEPDLIVQAASLVSPWATIGREHPIARALARAGFGVQLAAQLPVLTTVMRAVRKLGVDRPVANISFPDVAHAILAKEGLAPTIGLGNVSILHLRVRAALRARQGAAGEDDLELPLIRVVGHHNQVYDVVQCRRPDEPDRRVRVHLGEDGERADELAYEGVPFAPGPAYNVVTAAATLPVLTALLRGSTPVRFSAPGPNGLVGGYPVRIDGARVELDLPPGVALAEAEAYNWVLMRRDGVAGLDDDGTVHFTDDARGAVHDLAPELAEPLPPSRALARARTLRALVEKIG